MRIVSKYLILVSSTAALWALVSVGAVAQTIPAASPVAQAFARYATAGTFTEGSKHFAKSPGNAESVAARGMLQFADAIERLGQNMYRYGLRPHRALRQIPFLRFPVPANPKPETLSYAAMRSVYAQFLADVANAEATLAKLPPGHIKLPVDLVRIPISFGPNGPKIKLDHLLSNLLGRRMTGPSMTVAFDRADAIWMRGYCKLLSALSEFILAHDWSKTYAATAHLFFAGARDPLGNSQTQAMLFGQSSSSIADVVAMVHLVHWPVKEPARLLKVRDHLKSVVALSRENWKAILAETDDDSEWVPGPKQKKSATGLRVTQTQLDGWLSALASFEQVLNGQMLIPHWRFTAGIDLNAYFEKPRPFDLVLWTTGHAVRPYLKHGPTMSRADWRRWQNVFRGRFLLFAAWFN